MHVALVARSGTVTSSWRDRLEQHGCGLGHGVPEAEAPRHLEAHLGAVDGVVLAVEAGHLHVDDGVAEHAAVRHRLLDALLHRGDELAGDGAADDLVDELEARAALERLDPDRRPRRTGRGRRSASCTCPRPRRRR